MFLSAINLTASYAEAVGSMVWTVWSGLDLRICAAVFMNPPPDKDRYGQDYAPGASQRLQCLITRAVIPAYQVRFRWKRTAWPCGTTAPPSTTP